MPNYLASFSKNGMYDDAEALGVMSCVECGTCSFNCPGQVPNVQYIRKTKTHIGNVRRAQQAALAASKADAPANESNEEKKEESK